MKNTIAIIAALTILSLVMPIPSLRAQESPKCFPPCREGYLCSPEGKCVSSCNPACEESERCVDGSCLPRESAQETGGSNHNFSVMAGGVVQAASGKLEGTVGGLALAGLYTFGQMHNLLVEPRVILVFGNDTSQPEIGLNLGYRMKLGSGDLKGGFSAALATNLWINTEDEISDPVWFYIGGQVGGFVEYKSFTVRVPIDFGVLPFFNPTVSSFTVAFLLGFTF